LGKLNVPPIEVSQPKTEEPNAETQAPSTTNRLNTEPTNNTSLNNTIYNPNNTKYRHSIFNLFGGVKNSTITP
jgi:hypothetical protein